MEFLKFYSLGRPGTYTKRGTVNLKTYIHVTSGAAVSCSDAENDDLLKSVLNVIVIVWSCFVTSRKSLSCYSFGCKCAVCSVALFPCHLWPVIGFINVKIFHNISLSIFCCCFFFFLISDA